MAKQSTLSAEAEAELWTEWTENKDYNARRILIEHYLPFAHILAAKFYAGRQIPEIEFEDYRQYAIAGMIEAVDRYEGKREASFKSYSGHRITGAILNGIKSFCEKQQQINARAFLQQQRLNSLREDDAVTEEKKDLFQELMDLAIGLALGYMLDDTRIYQAEEDSYNENFYDRHELSQLKKMMKQIVSCLPEQSRNVINFHYFQGLSFEDIADIMNLSKGRVSQIHKSALKALQENYNATGALSLKL